MVVGAGAGSPRPGLSGGRAGEVRSPGSPAAARRPSASGRCPGARGVQLGRRPGSQTQRSRKAVLPGLMLEGGWGLENRLPGTGRAGRPCTPPRPGLRRFLLRGVSVPKCLQARLLGMQLFKEFLTPAPVGEGGERGPAARAVGGGGRGAAGLGGQAVCGLVLPGVRFLSQRSGGARTSTCLVLST